MKNQFVAQLLWMALSLFIPLASLAGPTSSGGGGNICITQTTPELLDMVVEEQIFPHQYTQGIQIPITHEKFTVFKPLNSSLKGRIDALTHPFMQRFPAIYAVLSMALENSWYIATPEEFKVAIGAVFQSPKTCNAQNTRAAIGLVAGIKFISIPTWNKLDFDTQAFLIIHEAVRFMQIVLGEPLTDLEVQQVTYDVITNASPRYAKMEDLRKYYCSQHEQMKAQAQNLGLDERATHAWEVGCKTPSELSSNDVLISISALTNQRNLNKTTQGPFNTQIAKSLQKQLKQLNVELGVQEQKNMMSSAKRVGLKMLDIPMGMSEEKLNEFTGKSRQEIENALSDLLNSLPQQ